MSVFEYPSILLAAVLGYSIVLLFDKVTYAITQKMVYGSIGLNYCWHSIY